MKILLALLAIASLTGCQSIADRNAKTRADQAAGQVAAAQGREIAAAVLAITKDIHPSK